MQRKIEAAGMTTITLSNIPDLTAAVSTPRVAAIEYPFGRTVGQPGDLAGQLAVLRATLQALEEMHTPGSVKHLPFEWPESPKQARTHPPDSPPIVKHLQRHPWHLRNLFSRDIPAQS
ncbi:MAG: hypothetical protein MUO67_05440 [Anaerolineales bacterium]|nr:hypothetical protein [Anaerolineales bacterium]